MAEKERIVLVTNRSAGFVGYTINESGISRQFTIGETKKIPYSEIEQLSWQPGGLTLIAEYLLIQDQEALDDLVEDQNLRVEPEYKLTRADIQKLMTQGSLEEWQDFLDFAPEGAKDIAKELAVILPLNDYNKRQAMKQQLNFDVDKAIENNQPDPEDVIEQKQTKRRVVKEEKEDKKPARRVVKRAE